jgi:hypothetical protein
LEGDRERVKEILVEGSRRVRGRARETLGEVRQAMRIDYDRRSKW